jgi:hypothetical protein
MHFCWYQNGRKHTKWPQNVPNGLRLYPMAVKWYQTTIKYTNILHSKALQNLHKLGFLVRKNNIWQPFFHWFGSLWADSELFLWLENSSLLLNLLNAPTSFYLITGKVKKASQSYSGSCFSSLSSTSWIIKPSITLIKNGSVACYWGTLHSFFHSLAEDKTKPEWGTLTQRVR